MNKIWRLKEEVDQNEVKHLSAALNVNMTIAKLLVRRGIKTYNDAKSFFRPRLTDLHDPFLMKGMDKAIERIDRALKNNEKIIIYGDYDVDGTTSVAMVYTFFRSRVKEIEYYIPNRYSEGYGISTQSIDYAVENGFTLIIALDCGIKAVDKIKKAKERGIDFIICDHHNPDDEVPPAVAVLDPKQNDCNYPYKELSGCGVGFKLLHAYSLKNDIELEEVYDLLDLLVVSIAADIVPITGENRVFAYYGLKKLNSNPGIGLQTIINYAGLNGSNITISDIVFKIGPRINASGRIEHGKKSVQIMVAEDEGKSDMLGEEIDSFNEIRRTLDRDITQDALDMIENNPTLKNMKSAVLYNRDWHKGVVGIVASRVTEQYHRPAIILTESNGLATGSARSVKGFDLYEAIGQCSDLLESYGGHTYAAGLTMKIENIYEFKERFEEIVKSQQTKEQQLHTIEVDAKISLSEITPKFFRVLKQFAPFGPYNSLPVFVTEDVFDAGTSRLVGRNKEHLKLDIVEPDINSGIFTGIAFNQCDKFELITSGAPFDICYSITENEYRGKVSLQLYLRDIKQRDIFEED